MLWTSLSELKGLLQIDPENSAEDKALNFYLDLATGWVEQYLNSSGYLRRERTEFYDGSGTQKLPLKCKPVWAISTVRVWLDESGLYGAQGTQAIPPFAANTELVYGDDFGLTSEDGVTSPAGTLLRRNNIWPRPAIRQRGFLTPYVGEGFGTIKVTYTAGHTADTLPRDIVLAVVMLVSRMRMLFPLGVPLSSESYEDRSIAQVSIGNQKSWLLAEVKPLLFAHRRHRF